MKLYTEEQVREAIKLIYSLPNKTYSEQIANVLSKFPPIELPSDDDIDKTAVEFAKKYRATTYEISAFIIGAKYINDKIKGFNDEQQ